MMYSIRTSWPLHIYYRIFIIDGNEINTWFCLYFFEYNRFTASTYVPEQLRASKSLSSTRSISVTHQTHKYPIMLWYAKSAGSKNDLREHLLNPFPQTAAFWRICSRRLWEISTLGTTCPTLLNLYTFISRGSPKLCSRRFQSRHATYLLCVGKGWVVSW